jgi:hypothetical protein
MLQPNNYNQVVAIATNTQVVKKLIPMNYGKVNSNKLWKAHFNELYKEIHSNKLEQFVLMR